MSTNSEAEGGAARPVHAPALAGCTLSVNQAAAPLVQALLDDRQRLGVTVSRDDATGVTLVDAGLSAPGSIEAGLLVGRICMGGFGSVALRSDAGGEWPTWLDVTSAQPVLACLGSQYAGWSLQASKEETGGKKFFALGSGPARALAAKEALYAELGWRDQAESGVLVLEVDRMPPAVVLDKVLKATGLAASALTVIVTPTRSRAGTTQVVARVLEVALHKAHEIGFDLSHIVEGSATAPLPAPHPDGLQAMGRTNDAILYGGRVHLQVTGDAQAAQDLAQRLPACNARGWGQSFADVFAAAGMDFYKIDPALFAPAEVWVSHEPSGATWRAGRSDLGLLMTQWSTLAPAAPR